jgi:Mrp family chromosome partitioning ATPase
LVNTYDVIEALKKVLDPEIGLNIVELDMVKDIMFSDGKISILIALTVPECPLASTIQADVERVLKELDSVKEVKVSTTAMSQEELNHLRDKLKSRMSYRTGKTDVTAGVIEKLDKKGIMSIIAVISGKGGVGKSFVSAMMAAELRRQGYEVGVLDADVTGPSIARIFGVQSKLTVGEKGILPALTKTGIKIISLNLLLDNPEQATVWRGPIINSIIKQLYSEVHWNNLHYLIVDLPPGTSDAPLTVYQSLPLDGVIVVSTPQDLAFMIVSKAVNMARAMNIPILGLIENMGYVQCPNCSEKIKIFGESRGEKVASKLLAPFFGVIPLDPKIAELSDQGRIEEYSNPIISEVVRGLRNTVLRAMGESANVTPIAWGKTN